MNETHTLPRTTDSDGDGMNDGNEIIFHYEPLDADSDDDGTLDDDENCFPAEACP